MLQFIRYLLAAGITAAATAASAGDLMPDVADGVMNSCRPDYHHMCSYVVPGDGRAARCLLDHETDLSPGCLKAIKIATAVEACIPDYRRYCAGVPRGPQAFDCLAGRMDMLLPECRRVVSANAPYMDASGERYGYNRGPAPYAGPDANGYAYPYAALEEGGYANGEQPGARSYAYRDPQPYDGRYADEGASRFRDRYAWEGSSRFQPYGGRYADPGYADRSYGNGRPPLPYSPDGEGDPAR